MMKSKIGFKPLHFHCANCQSPPGRPCTEQGKPQVSRQPSFHQERIDAAQEATDAEKAAKNMVVETVPADLPTDEERARKILPTLEEYVAAGYSAADYPLFVENHVKAGWEKPPEKPPITQPTGHEPPTPV